MIFEIISDVALPVAFSRWKDIFRNRPPIDFQSEDEIFNQRMIRFSIRRREGSMLRKAAISSIQKGFDMFNFPRRVLFLTSSFRNCSFRATRRKNNIFWEQWITQFIQICCLFLLDLSFWENSDSCFEWLARAIHMFYWNKELVVILRIFNEFSRSAHDILPEFHELSEYDGFSDCSI